MAKQYLHWSLVIVGALMVAASHTVPILQPLGTIIYVAGVYLWGHWNGYQKQLNDRT